MTIKRTVPSVGSSGGGGDVTGKADKTYVDAADAALDGRLDTVETTLPGKANASDVTTALAGKQPLDADLTAIAALESTTAGALATDGAGWVRKTYAQLKTALGIGASDLTATGTRSSSTYLRGDNTWAAVSGGVSSVNTETGAVVLDAADVGATRLTVNGTYASTYDLDTSAVTPADIGAVPTSRTVTAGTGLTGGGDLTANRTFAVTYGTTGTTAAAGNDARLSDTRTPTDASVTNAKVATGAAVDLDKTADSATRLAMTSAERTKLTGVATGATANSSDATLLARANHTGTQAATTITGLATVATSGAKADVGLGNVDNVSDANKPVSTAQALAISTVTANTQTGSYTLVLADAGKAVEMNVATANTLTVPPNSSVAFPTGTVIEVLQYGAGQTTITPGAGVTLRNASSLTTRAQYSTVSLRKRATDEWVVAGDVS